MRWTSFVRCSPKETWTGFASRPATTSRKRVATAFRRLLVVVESFLSGQTLGFSVIRAFFVRRFGPIRPRAFQLRFKSASEIKLWRALVGTMQRGVLYLLDLGFYCKDVFRQAQKSGAHVLMRLKSKAKIRVVAGMHEGRMEPLPDWALSTLLKHSPSRRGTTMDLDIRWGKGATALDLRLVGVSLGGKKGWRFYLTTVPRSLLTTEQVIETYRLRWLIEFLFREWKQQADLGRSFTADRDALNALTYGAMLSHALVRSLRVVTAVRHDIPLEQLRPLACLHAIRPFNAEIIDALSSRDNRKWQRLFNRIGECMLEIAHEQKPSKSRPRVARALGAGGG